MAARFRAAHGIGAADPVLVLMPGSRRSEVPRLLPVFGATLALLARELPGLRPVLPVSAVVRETVERAAAGWPVRPVIVTEVAEKHDAYAAAARPGLGAALTKSGTSTLELALAGVPMAVTYRVNPISAFMARRMIRVPHVAMVNLLAGRALVPELLQEDCNPRALAERGIGAVARSRAGGGAACGIRGGGGGVATGLWGAIGGGGAGGSGGFGGVGLAAGTLTRPSRERERAFRGL